MEPLPPRASPPSPAAQAGRGGAADDSIAAYRWLLEEALVQLRWWQVPLCLLLIARFPQVAPPWVVGLALGLGLGNAGLAWLVRGGYQPARLRLVSRLATGLEWLVGLGVIGLSGHHPGTTSPALLLALLLLAGLRFGRRGLLAGAVAAILVVVILVALQYWVLQVIEAVDALRALVGWFLLITVMLLSVAGLLRAGSRWRRWEESRWLREQADLRRLQYRLSRREWELLPWLAREELTYEQIGALLHISPDTVKTHVQRIAAKLGTRGGRQAVVAAARERGLLPPSPAAPATANRDQDTTEPTEDPPEDDTYPPPDGQVNPSSGAGQSPEGTQIHR